MTSILGISAFYHDSAAVLIKEGEIIAAAQEERFTRNKHDSNYPKKAVDFVLEEARVQGQSYIWEFENTKTQKPEHKSYRQKQCESPDIGTKIICLRIQHDH